MKKYIIFLTVSLVFIFNSCELERNCDYYVPRHVSVVKFLDDHDYVNNVIVIIDEEEEHVIGYPGSRNISHDIYYYFEYQGYYLTICYQPETRGFIDVTFDEWTELYDTVTYQILDSLAIIGNPYEEYYFDSEDVIWDHENSWERDSLGLFFLDTVRFKEIVDSALLDFYFERVI